MAAAQKTKVRTADVVIGSTYVHPSVVNDLRFYFQCSAAAFHFSSNYKAMVAKIAGADGMNRMSSSLDGGSDERGQDRDDVHYAKLKFYSMHDVEQETGITEAMLVDIARHRRVHHVLGELSERDYNTLEDAHADRAWPNALESFYQGIVGVVVTTDAAKAGYRAAMKKSRARPEGVRVWLDYVCRHQANECADMIQVIRQEAESRIRNATLAYVKAEREHAGRK